MANPIFDPEGHANENVTRIDRESQSTRPFDLVELPSKGKLYSGALKDKTHVEVYYLTAKEEDILTSQNLLSSGKMFDTLLRSVLVDRKIDPSKLLLGDRNTILTWLRTTGYGADYNVSVVCESCGQKFDHEFNLASLNLRYLEVEPDEDGLFSIELPSTKKTARVSFLTAQEDREIDQIISTRIKKLGGSGNAVTEKLRKYVKDVEGVSPDEMKSFIETLPAADSRKIRKWISDNDPTVLMVQDAVCAKCGELNEEVNIPITITFLWPDART